MDRNGLTSFYASDLQVWQIFSVERVNVWNLEEPLFFNGLLSTDLLNSGTLRNNLIKAGLCKIGHLKINNQWITAEELHLKIEIRSLRVLQRLLEEFKESFVSLDITFGEL